MQDTGCPQNNVSLALACIFFLFSALGNLGNVLTQKGRLQAAEVAFKKALEYRTNMADTHYNL